MSNIIEIKKISKTFKIKEKEKGFVGSLKSIVKPKYKIKKAVHKMYSFKKSNKIKFFLL